MSAKGAMLGVVLASATALLVGTTVAVVADGPDLTAEEQLGKAIFFDETLSINGNQSCATCHGPGAGWTGPDSAINAHGSVYEGSIPGRFGDRKPPSSAYATFAPILHVDKKGLFVGGNFWDGRATGEKLGNPAADQAQGPFLNPKEQGLPDLACVVYLVCTAADYPVSFESVFGADTCAITWPVDVDVTCATEGTTVALSDADRAKALENYDSIARAIAAYEASAESNAFTAKVDHARGGRVHLTKEEQRGHALFNGKGRCKNCHPGNGPQPLFTDFTFDNLGLPKNPENPVYTENPGFVDEGLGGFLRSVGHDDDVVEENVGKHKVPTLRNVGRGLDNGLIKAFGHNGYFKSVEGIVHFYNTRDVKPTCPGDYTEAEAIAAGCWPAPEVLDNLNTDELGNLGLSPEEEAAIVAFLKALSDGYY